MRAITLWQPWASLWLSPLKVHETRSWPIDTTCDLPGTQGAGWIVVHAAQRRIRIKEIHPELRALLTDEFGGDWIRELPRGAIVGVLELDRCEVIGAYGPAGHSDRLSGNWGIGRYAWHRARWERFPDPIPWIGHQRIFHVHSSALGMRAFLGPQ